MERLSKKNEFGHYEPIRQGRILHDCLDKLGQLEDIEDELGIDLITLFKALRQDFVYVRTNSGVEKNKGFNICGFTLWSQVKLNPKDYGKTWATSKEELE